MKSLLASIRDGGGVERVDHVVHLLEDQWRRHGETLQASNTRQMIFRIGHVLAYLSQVFTLQPGDLVFTGTPSGVGYARTPPWLLQPGDVVEVEVDRLGVLTNRVVANDSRKA